MLNFTYANKCEINFGKLPESHNAECVKKHGGKRVLLHFGGGSIIRSGLHAKIIKALTDAGLYVLELGGVRPNPNKALAFEGIALAIKNKIDFILAVGGGSVIDSAKCIGAGVPFVKNGGTVEQYWTEKFVNKGRIESSLPVGTVPTIPAAGSECSMDCVIRNEENGLKYTFGATEHSRPKFAFINPEYCQTLPKNQIANGASDIFAHLFERFFATSEVVDAVVTDHLLVGAMKSVLEVSPKVWGNPNDYTAFANLFLMSTLAHNGMLSMGRGSGCWASHNIDMALLSGLKDIAHGEGLAIVMPAYLKFMLGKKPERVEQFIREVATIKELEKFFKSIELPTRLSDMGLCADEIKSLASQAFPPDKLQGGYAQLTIAEIEQIIELAK
jgi:hypothetical protein